jgi:hypothetical protein
MEIIGGVERRRWRLEEKLRIVAESEELGACFAEVARRCDLTQGLLWNWRNQVRRGALAGRSEPMFLLVHVTGESVTFPRKNGHGYNLRGRCSATIKTRLRIASPETLPGADPLPHLICSRPVCIGGRWTWSGSAWRHEMSWWLHWPGATEADPPQVSFFREAFVAFRIFRLAGSPMFRFDGPVADDRSRVGGRCRSGHAVSGDDSVRPGAGEGAGVPLSRHARCRQTPFDRRWRRRRRRNWTEATSDGCSNSPCWRRILFRRLWTAWNRPCDADRFDGHVSGGVGAATSRPDAYPSIALIQHGRVRTPFPPWPSKPCGISS